MSDNQDQQVLKDIFIDIFNVSLSENELCVKNIDSWDSLSHIKLVMRVESSFQIKIPLKEIPLLYTDFITILNYIHENRKRQ